MKTLNLLTITALAGILTMSTLNAQEDYDRSTARIKHDSQHQEVKKEVKTKKDTRVKENTRVKKDVRVKKDIKVKKNIKVKKDTQQHRVSIIKKAPVKKHAIKLLKRGDRGANVKALQRALKQEGLYRGHIDGVFGKGVKRAVQSFQREQRLYADGVAGAKTLRLLHLR